MLIVTLLSHSERFDTPQIVYKVAICPKVDPISTKNLQQVLELVVQPAGARITCCNHWFSPLLDITPISSSLLDIGVLSFVVLFGREAALSVRLNCPVPVLCSAQCKTVNNNTRTEQEVHGQAHEKTRGSSAQWKWGRQCTRSLVYKRQQVIFVIFHYKRKRVKK